ncbi:MAG: hypothetical protein V3R37_07620 [Rhodospirillales bacterium]
MFESDRARGRRIKLRANATLVLESGGSLDCELFLAQGQRLIDLFNDTRDYIPASDKDGQVFFIKKSEVVMIKPADQTLAEFNVPPQWIGKSYQKHNLPPCRGSK